MTTTIERLATLETKAVSIEAKVDGLDVKLDRLIDNLDKRYASKLSERLIYGLVGLIIIAFATAVINNYITLHPTPNSPTTQGPTVQNSIALAPSATPTAGSTVVVHDSTTPTTITTPTPSPTTQPTPQPTPTPNNNGLFNLLGNLF